MRSFCYNNNPDFTEQEVLTIYLYAMNVEQRLKKSQYMNTQAIIVVPGSHYYSPIKH
jgi:hypothetical protein